MSYYLSSGSVFLATFSALSTTFSAWEPRKVANWERSSLRGENWDSRGLPSLWGRGAAGEEFYELFHENVCFI